VAFDLGPAPPVLQARPRQAFSGCPLCMAQRPQKLREGDCSRHPLYQPIIPARMIWMACKKCGHVFTDGYFPQDVATVVFTKTHSGQTLGSDLERQRAMSGRIVERVAQYVPKGVWLDVGFGSGSLLLTAQEWGFEPVGIDLRADNVRDLSRLGVEAHCLELAQLDHQNRYAVISMADVLEHMPFPKEALVAAHQLLQPDGILFVSTPNYESPVWRTLDLKNVNPYWDEIEHFHNFGRARLYKLLEEMRFAPFHFAISERYRVGMEVLSRPKSSS
jgi:SAM-dependent methyltransferase